MCTRKYLISLLQLNMVCGVFFPRGAKVVVILIVQIKNETKALESDRIPFIELNPDVSNQGTHVRLHATTMSTS